MSVELATPTQAMSWTYAMLDARQREIAREIRSGERNYGALLLSELAPVVTCGRRTPESDLTGGAAFLRRSGIETYETDRGGLATYHGPGQWVLFAVDRVERLLGRAAGAKTVVEALLDLAFQAARPWQAHAEIRWGAETGLWSPKGKLASVGIRVQRGIVLHGVALNVFETPLSFSGIRPCGLDLPPAFLHDGAMCTDREALFSAVGHALQEAAFQTFWRGSVPALRVPEAG